MDRVDASSRESRKTPRTACLLLCTALVLGAGIPVSGADLRIVTINVWSGLDYQGFLKMGEYEDAAQRETRYRTLVEKLRVLNPDLVALNEANKLPRYARRLAEDLGFDFIYHVGLGGVRAGPVGLPVNLREGDVILAGKPFALRTVGRRRLSGGPVGNFFTFHFSDATQVVGGRIGVEGRTVFVFVTHWHSSPFDSAEGHEKRMIEARKTLGFIREKAGENPCVFLGDFNALPSSEEIGLVLADGFVDAYAAVRGDEGFTWDEARNRNIDRYYFAEPGDLARERRRDRIDYIFFRGRGMSVVDAQVVLDSGEDHPSDHFGVLAQLRFGPP